MYGTECVFRWLFSIWQKIVAVRRAIHDEFNQFLRKRRIRPNSMSADDILIDLATQTIFQMSMPNATQNSLIHPLFHLPRFLLRVPH